MLQTRENRVNNLWFCLIIFPKNEEYFILYNFMRKKILIWILCPQHVIWICAHFTTLYETYPEPKRGFCGDSRHSYLGAAQCDRSPLQQETEQLHWSRYELYVFSSIVAVDGKKENCLSHFPHRFPPQASGFKPTTFWSDTNFSNLLSFCHRCCFFSVSLQ